MDTYFEEAARLHTVAARILRSYQRTHRDEDIAEYKKIVQRAMELTAYALASEIVWTDEEYLRQEG